ncbi:MAG TPA: TetR/AcrR family transcriptional regulator [Chloroflexia bacterium]|nr:TetR/AcrR family transcriptional regulator [Chloroflexia bacterium]
MARPRKNPPDSSAQVVSSLPSRQKIMACAQKLFLKKGFEGVNIREIMEEADVTQPAIYYYFKNKDGLFLAVLLQTLEELDRKFAQAARKETFLEQLEGLIGLFSDPDGPSLSLLFKDLQRRVELNARFPEQGITLQEARKAFLFVNQNWPRALETLLRDARYNGEVQTSDTGFVAHYLLTLLTAYAHSPFLPGLSYEDIEPKDKLLNYLKTTMKISSSSAQI